MAYTNAQLVVRSSDAPTVERLLNGRFDVKNTQGTLADRNLVEYEFYEVQDVNLAVNLGIEAELKAQRMPFSLTWDDADDWEAGSEHYRVDFDGNYVKREFGPEGPGKLDLSDLLAAQTENRVESYIAKMRETVGVLSWEDQEKILNGITVFVRDNEVDQVEQLLLDHDIAFHGKVEDDAQGVGFVLRGQQCTQIDDIEGLLSTVFVYDVVGDVDGLLSLASQTAKSGAIGTEFTLADEHQPGAEHAVTGRVEVADGVSLRIAGYSDCNSTDDNGTLAWLEKLDGDLKLYVYADINREEPTHVISLEGARNDRRQAEL